ncbi:hypothetical protein LB518_22920 [Mesorhizobium sp. BR1-1-16]|uniref:hypothetical protein n=1 Tax=Mesorhizobium sp. BR1-1-16 TaxID=2876653 RepID=UPI001CD03FFB|nr:hypothetical protein [Mesorhizobium sp. BR1-1-16]MBZ9939168.1 hypothetical protein [Mesorhizobium sp. BR1-1-16]
MSPAPTWTADEQALYDERAAIAEYDGGLPRKIAEATARGEVAKARREAEQSRNSKQAA